MQRPAGLVRVHAPRVARIGLAIIWLAHLGVAWAQLPFVSPATQAEKRCIQDALPAVTASCSATNSSTRDALVKLLQRCLVNETSSTARSPMRLMLFSSTMSTLVKQATTAYAQLTNTPIQVNTIPITVASATVLKEIQQGSDRNKSSEAWMTISSYLLGEAVPMGAFQNVTNLVAVDSQINWPGLLPILRTGGGLMFASEVYALPITAFTSQIMYRKDVFAKYNIPLPRTWRELLTYARQWNGTDGMNAFCIMDSICYGGSFTILWNMMASMMQTFGYKHGIFFDPTTMETLLQNEAMAMAFSLLKSFLEMSPRDMSVLVGCPPYPNSFAQGQCMAVFFAAGAWKGMSYKPRIDQFRRVQGKIGFMRFPGSEVVLDRPSKKLVLCDRDRCPYADSVTNPDGTTTLINRSPFFDVSTYNINAKLPPDLAFFTYNVLSHLCSDSISTMLALNPDGGVIATRASHLNVSLWVAAGYDQNDTTEMINDFREQLSHPNYHVALRVPGAFDGYNEWLDAIAGLKTLTIEQAMAKLTRNFQALVLSRLNGSVEKFRDIYWQSLNLDPTNPPTPPPAPPPQATARDAQPTGAALSPGLTALAVILPIGLVAIAALAIVRYVRRRLSFADESKHPPGACVETTLVVSDIEDSTELWEELDAQVMDAAVKLHNVCIRKLVTEHKGYESVWEDAIAFCMELQQQLLTLAWPAPILTNPRTKEVWCHEVHSGGKGLRIKTNATGWFSSIGPALRTRVSNPGTPTGPGSHPHSPRLPIPTALMSAVSLPPPPSMVDARPRLHHAATVADATVGVEGRASDRAPAYRAGLSSMVQTGIVQASMVQAGPSKRGAYISSGPSSGAEAGPSGSNSTSVAGPSSGAEAGPSRQHTAVALGPPGRDWASPSTCGAAMLPGPSSSAQTGHSDRVAIWVTGPSSGCEAGPSNRDAGTSGPSSGTDRLIGLADIADALGRPQATDMRGVGGEESVPWGLERCGSGTRPEPCDTLASQWRAQWVVCDAGSESAVLAYRGLRVRLGLHAGVNGVVTMTFNKHMQRYHYTGAIRAISDAVASAGHGGHTLINTSTLALLSDGQESESDELKGLPSKCGLYYQGKYVLSGVAEPQCLVLILPDTLRCRLGLQQEPLRTQAMRALGVWSAPATHLATTDATALVVCGFVGLGTLLAWDAEQARAAIELASVCLHSAALDYDGSVSVDGLERVAIQQARNSNPSKIAQSAQVVVSIYGPSVCDAPGLSQAPGTALAPHVGVRFALDLRSRLLRLAWAPELLSHELATPLGVCVREDRAAWHVGSSALSETAVYDSAQYALFNAAGLRGLRCKWVVVGARDATCQLDTRCSGRLAFSGPAVKRAQKVLARAKPGQVVAEAMLAGLASGPVSGPRSGLRLSPRWRPASMR